jgi:hypothetical protein
LRFGLSGCILYSRFEALGAAEDRARVEEYKCARVPEKGLLTLAVFRFSTHCSMEGRSQMAESSPGPLARESEPSGQAPESIFLVSFPKVIFLYPTFVAALAAGISMLFVSDPLGHSANVVALMFLLVFAVNMIVFSFDFPRTTSLTLFFFCVAVAIGLWTLFRLNPNLLPPVTNLLRSNKPIANATLYFSIAALLGAIYLWMLVSIQFDYWEVRPNELLHHHGILSDLKRYSAPNLRIDKEINDVFEYLLLRSGRLILHPSEERRAIVLENVFPINRKEEQITRMLGALQVRLRSDNNR